MQQNLVDCVEIIKLFVTKLFFSSSYYYFLFVFVFFSFFIVNLILSILFYIKIMYIHLKQY